MCRPSDNRKWCATPIYISPHFLTFPPILAHFAGFPSSCRILEGTSHLQPGGDIQGPAATKGLRGGMGEQWHSAFPIASAHPVNEGHVPQLSQRTAPEPEVTSSSPGCSGLDGPSRPRLSTSPAGPAQSRISSSQAIHTAHEHGHGGTGHNDATAAVPSKCDKGPGIDLKEGTVPRPPNEGRQRPRGIAEGTGAPSALFSPTDGSPDVPGGWPYRDSEEGLVRTTGHSLRVTGLVHNESPSASRAPLPPPKKALEGEGRGAGRGG